MKGLDEMGMAKDFDGYLEGLALKILLEYAAIEPCMAGGLYHDTGAYTRQSLDEIPIPIGDEYPSEDILREKMREVFDDCGYAEDCQECHPKWKISN